MREGKGLKKIDEEHSQQSAERRRAEGGIPGGVCGKTLFRG